MRPRLHFLFALSLAIVFSGCSLSGHKQSAAPTLKTYRDKEYSFSFKYPSSWTLGKDTGKTIRLSGAPTYVVQLGTSGQDVGIRITVNPRLQSSDYSMIPEGKVAPYGDTTLHYHHLTVSSWPSIQIEQYSGRQMDGLYTITNTRQNGYQVAMKTASPPFTPAALNGYHTIVKTMRLPF